MDNKLEAVNKPRAVKASSPGASTGHPHQPHDHDLVAVQVLHAQGVRFGGHTYRPGQTLVMPRARAGMCIPGEPGKRPVRVLKTVRYVHGPLDQAEDQPEEGPLDLDQERP